MDYNIKDNLKYVLSCIDSACKKASRQNNEVSLIAVSKTKPVEELMEAYDFGIRDFGENKVQELCEKYDEMPKDIRWHMIGHLQRNKVKYIVDKVFMIHSVDSLRLACQIEEEARKKDVVCKILLEVNVAEEESKFGLTNLDEIVEILKEISTFSHVKVMGLMTVAPYTENAEDNREFFNKLKKLSVDIKAKNIDNISMEVLSMGMTGDYEIAILEGSTMVRVGTGIFGRRNYNII